MRNGKTTLTESVGNLLGDYCVTAQPQTFSRRNSDGSAASPDTARLKGARLINIPESEQDKTLKQEFRKAKNKSAILNRLIEGYRLILEAGFDPPNIVKNAIAEYRQDADIIGVFLSECTEPKGDSRVATSELYVVYSDRAKTNGYKPLSNRGFTMNVHRRYEIRRDSVNGRAVIGIVVKK